ncbi:phosphomannomutase/phosphoglucomutase [Candidatus Falkowbacteria bacterium]|nr:phosphomannomutase/phosphoglucomutase [Candidatus Falkowbacteria bacterium]
MLSINPKIFKAYDIRGIYGQDFDNELAYLLGLAFVELKKHDSDYNMEKPLDIAVARDMRESSLMLKDNLIRGLTAAGANVFDLDLVSTPSFYFAVGKNNYDGGIMISASHNPKEWNGFKLVRRNGRPVSGDTGIMFLKDKIFENKFMPPLKPGIVTKISGTLEEELSFSFANINSELIKPLKVVADAANSMGALYLEKIFTHLKQCELIKLNFTLDGTFPAHEADPLKEENLAQLKAAVIKNKADLGIATDGDGDRIFFIDNKGEVIKPSILRGLLAKIFLKDQPGAKIGYDVRPGKITIDMINESGGIPVVTKVGHSLIKEQMLTEGIYFAGESSGHFYLNTAVGCFEYPTLMILKLLIEFSSTSEPTSLYIEKYEKYYASGEINCAVIDKEAVFTRIKNIFSDGKINTLDGVSVSYDNFWFNVRGSNTEEKVRLNLEAINEDLVKEKTEEILKIIKQ